MADVSLRGGLGYDRPLLRETLSEMILAVGGWPAAIKPGSRALIKVNMLSAKKPEMGITTHPELVGAIAELLLEKDCQVAIGDSPGGATQGVDPLLA